MFADAFTAVVPSSRPSIRLRKNARQALEHGVILSEAARFFCADKSKDPYYLRELSAAVSPSLANTSLQRLPELAPAACAAKHPWQSICAGLTHGVGGRTYQNGNYPHFGLPKRGFPFMGPTLRSSLEGWAQCPDAAAQTCASAAGSLTIQWPGATLRHFGFEGARL
jgi:hypothetical protein